MQTQTTREEFNPSDIFDLDEIETNNNDFYSLSSTTDWTMVETFGTGFELAGAAADEKLEKRRERQREAVKRHRKRKNAEIQKLRDDAKRLMRENRELERKLQLSKTAPLDTQTVEERENLVKVRRGKLQQIWEAWNIGGIDDMQEVANQVYAPTATLFTPDHTEAIVGIKAIMAHWQSLFDAFPDGIMEEYDIMLESHDGEKVRAKLPQLCCIE